MRQISHVVGLDLSLSCTGMCIIPLDWGGDILECRFDSVMTRPSMSILDRCSVIAEYISGAVTNLTAPHIGAESLRGSYSQAKLGILHGYVACTMSAYPYDHDVPISTARKLFLGRSMPAVKKAKQLIFEHMTSIPGVTDLNADEVDAFVIANYMASQLGAVAWQI